MTWSQLMQRAANHAPNAKVFLTVNVQGYTVPLNFELGTVRSEGQLVFLEGVHYDERESQP